MTTILQGIRIANYRSFAPSLETIGPFKKINLFVGQNNAGKSKVLKLLVERYRAMVGNNMSLSNHERHGRNADECPEIEIGFPYSPDAQAWFNGMKEPNAGLRAECLSKIAEKNGGLVYLPVQLVQLF